jgi:Na+-transporting NADH:ubiquinone oxidoreductase subunit NqrE
MLAIVALAGVREKMKYSNVPGPLKGIGNYVYPGGIDVAWIS